MNDDQVALWNGRAGQSWTDGQQLLDAMYLPFEQELVDAATSEGAKRVLDVGCGTGATTLAVARLPGVHCTGVDVSRPMLELARRRGEGTRASFVEGDAQSHAFQGFDLIVSRFGVMFFADPVRAFTNLRAAGSALHVITWRAHGENAFMLEAERAAAPLLPQLPARDLNGPGQFGLADPERTRDILRQSGWSEIDVEPLDVLCTFPASELLRYLTRLGPLGVMLPDLDEALRERVLETVLRAFEPYVFGDEVRFLAACWTVRAR
ncbi:MAG: class I SAM-dependent methyltransferase [Polyangiales bacterium]